MANPEWGAKHICHSCGTRYYDLQRSPIVCPKCNTQYDPEAFLKSRRTRAAAVEDLPAPKAAAKKKAEPKPEVVADEPEEAAEVELEADADTAALDELDKADDTTDPAPDDDDDDDDADVLLEDASELGDDDVGTVVDIGKDEDPNA